MKVKLEYDDEKDSISFGLTYTTTVYDGIKDLGFNTIAEVPTTAFDTAFVDQLPYLPSGILPPAIRYLSPDHSIVLWERPPGYVPFNYTGAMQENLKADSPSKNMLRLPVPWQRYVMLLSQDGQIANLFMFFAKDQIKSLSNDPFLQAPILNFYANNRLCPASYTSIKSYSHDILGAIEAAYEMVWSSGFNIDTILGINNFFKHTDRKINPLSKHVNNVEKMYDFWVKNTLSTVMSWGWNPVYKSFDDFIARKDLYHDYNGKNHEKLIKFIFAAQSARNAG